MPVKRSRPGKHEVRRGNQYGPDYPVERARSPWGDDDQYGTETEKAIYSENGSLFEPEVPIVHEYDKLWEGD